MCKYILTVDTGGSKTQITLFNHFGEKIKDARCKGIGSADEKETHHDLLLASLSELLPTHQFHLVKRITINVGGKNTKQIKAEFSYFFPDTQIDVFRESSGVIMAALCDAEKTDAILMAGTGTIALAKGPAGNVITDGWCPNIGDAGSGYWIGLEAIKRSVVALETESKLTPLVKYITGLNTPFSAFKNTTEQMVIRDEVRSHFTPLERSAVAALCKNVTEFAYQGDELAIQILKEAGKELAKTVVRGLKIAKCNDNAKVLVSGGLIHCINLWKSSFEQTLNEEYASITWRTGDADMTKGAIYYALHC